MKRPLVLQARLLRLLRRATSTPLCRARALASAGTPLLWALLLLAPGPGHAGPPALSPAPAPAKLTPCEAPLPAATHPGAPIGEQLSYELDVMGVKAGTLSLRAGRPDKATRTYVARAKSGPLFDDVRRLRVTATSYARRGEAGPYQYREEGQQDGLQRTADVRFSEAANQPVDIRWTHGARRRRVRPEAAFTGHDMLSLVYRLRTIPLAPGARLCADVYANRSLWRVVGEVQAAEWVTTPAGQFLTWRVAAVAQQHGRPAFSRELYLWVSQDEARLPVAALGMIDLGAVRATLTKVSRPGQAAKRPTRLRGRW